MTRRSCVNLISSKRESFHCVAAATEGVALPAAATAAAAALTKLTAAHQLYQLLFSGCVSIRFLGGITTPVAVCSAGWRGVPSASADRGCTRTIILAKLSVTAPQDVDKPGAWGLVPLKACA